MRGVVLGLALACLSALPGCAAPGWEARALGADERVRCDACAAETDAGAGGGRWPDERATCAACREGAVVSIDEARDVLAEARAALEDELGLEGLASARPRLRLSERPRLLELAGEVTHPDLRAFTEVVEVVDGDVVESRRFTVHVLAGLPRPSLLGILCHELFHVWQTLHGGVRPRADPAFREGAAQYVQYRVLELSGAERWTSRLLANQDPVYGEGLRRFLELVKDRGESVALELGATRDCFPPGF